MESLEPGGIGCVVIDGWRLHVTGIEMRRSGFVITASALGPPIQGGKRGYVLLGRDGLPVHVGTISISRDLRPGDRLDVEIVLTDTAEIRN
jgi:hypothetical protein